MTCETSFVTAWVLFAVIIGLIIACRCLYVKAERLELTQNRLGIDAEKVAKHKQVIMPSGIESWIDEDRN